MSGDNPPDAKKAKLEEDSQTAEVTEIDRDTLKGFTVEEVLLDNPKSKFLTVRGSFEHSTEKKPAVLILEKSSFDKTQVQKMLTEKLKLDHVFQNDIYGKYDLFADPALNAIKGQLIYPATQKHINKYSDQDLFVVRETSQDYSDVTLPYIEAGGFSFQWVYNILEKKCESDRIIFEDTDPETGFILLPDLKWNREHVESLYCQCIVHAHGIKSLRDLRGKHLPLLKNILEHAPAAVAREFEVPLSKLRLYLHYQPSFYHLHIHVAHVKLEAAGTSAIRDHDLGTVIQNIELCDDYYSRATLSFGIRDKDGLCNEYRKIGRL